MQIDTTPLDVLAILDDGVTGRVELTIAVDVASRTICAAILRPAGTKAVDAALLLAQMLVPEPMRPGWSDALRTSASLIPHARLMSADARLEHAAARPVIVPDAIIVDRGKVFVSDTFVAACRLAGVDVEGTGPFAGRRGGQIASRYTLIPTSPFRHKTEEQRGSGCSLVATLEESLRLRAHRPGTLLDLSSYLHDRTGGMIGSLSHLVREAALDALLDGSEKMRARLGAGERAERLGADGALLVGNLALMWAQELLHTAPLESGRQRLVHGLYDAMLEEVMYGQYLDVMGTGRGADDVEAALRIITLLVEAGWPSAA